MFDFARARHMMVEGQLRTNEITRPGIVGAMSELPRERFLPASHRTLAYSDRETPIGENRLLPSPMVLGKLLSAADIQPGEFVLHIGCTTGYGTAIISRLANSVVALEDNDILAQTATANLAALDASNVAVVVGPLSAGWPDEAPYDVIFIEGSVEELPVGLAGQLKDHGRLVAVLGSGRTGRGTVFRRAGDGLSGFPAFNAGAPILPGFERRPSFVF